jgi:hypothetical protein
VIGEKVRGQYVVHGVVTGSAAKTQFYLFGAAAGRMAPATVSWTRSAGPPAILLELQMPYSSI